MAACSAKLQRVRPVDAVAQVDQALQRLTAACAESNAACVTAAEALRSAGFRVHCAAIGERRRALKRMLGKGERAARPAKQFYFAVRQPDGSCDEYGPFRSQADARAAKSARTAGGVWVQDRYVYPRATAIEDRPVGC